MPKPNYYRKNINAGLTASPIKVTLADTSTADLHELVEKIETIYKDHVPEIATEILTHEVLRQRLQDPYYGSFAQKHLQQQASILGHMEQLGLLKNGHCFVEFGAGKGQMSHWVQQASPHSEDSHFVLVDRGANRYKFDSFHKEEGPAFERIRMDIAHLNLSEIPSIKEKHTPIIGFSKHLCGAATDLALCCLASTLPPPPSDNTSATGLPEEPTLHQCRGVVIALCCHHRSDWNSYVGKRAFSEWGLSAADFSLICGMTSWATCKLTDAGEQANSRDNADSKTDVTVNHDENVAANAVRWDREQVGGKCKRLIDHGRILYMKERGFDCRVRFYVDSSVSPENVLLIATNDDNTR
ncbi:PREDICTED: tRNA:m(4)X modification enzyme TRM13 homolog isoform X2 [Priapulus caudatus]|nr:PREDICTED: tRNA:m(4)X modification enzyme TRM13 homolog isoform X2 [Priapulus caudatus]